MGGMMTRKEFLVGGVGAAIVGVMGVGVGWEREEFPIVELELGEKCDWLGETDESPPMAMTVRVDFEDEDDWGDLNVVWVGDARRIGLGNDVDGYRIVERAYEVIEPRLESLEDKHSVRLEVTMDYLEDLLERRVKTWCGESPGVKNLGAV